MSKAINNQDFFNAVKLPHWEKPPMVVAWKFSSPGNLGALLRVCDNFGVKQVYFIGVEADYNLTKIKRNATTSFSKITLNFIGKSEIWNVIPANYTKLAIDTTSDSVSLVDFNFVEVHDSQQSFCLFFGNETVGLNDEVINNCDAAIHIPMIGETYSMNVVQAASVVLFESVRQCLRF